MVANAAKPASYFHLFASVFFRYPLILPNSKLLPWALSALSLLLNAASHAQEQWFPLEVEVWDPPFNQDLKRTTVDYQALDSASGDWKICVSIPHLKDPYWLAVNYGLIAEARRLGVAVSLYEAGGYEQLPIQREQISRCLKEGYDGLIIGAITRNGLDDLLVQAKAQNVPVVDMINGVNPENISARVAAEYWDNADNVARYLVRTHPTDTPPGRIAWFPGPQTANWVDSGNAGFLNGLKGGNLEVVTTRYGDTGRTIQRRLVEEVLDEGIEIDYIVGTAVTAEAAISVLRTRGLTNSIDVISYYYSPGVHRAVRRGFVRAASTDQQTLQSRIALDTMVRILEGRDFNRHVAPAPVLIERNMLSTWDDSTSLPPRGFRPIFSYNP